MLDLADNANSIFLVTGLCLRDIHEPHHVVKVRREHLKSHLRVARLNAAAAAAAAAAVVTPTDVPPTADDERFRATMGLMDLGKAPHTKEWDRTSLFSREHVARFALAVLECELTDVCIRLYRHKHCVATAYDSSEVQITQVTGPLSHSKHICEGQEF